MRAQITANGVYELTPEGYTLESKLTVLSPAVIGGATVTVGYNDSTDTFVPFTDGALAAGANLLVNSGAGVNVVANVTGFTAGFTIQTADSRSR